MDKIEGLLAIAHEHSLVIACHAAICKVTAKQPGMHILLAAAARNVAKLPLRPKKSGAEVFSGATPGSHRRTGGSWHY
jgi:hypothetical protein